MIGELGLVNAIRSVMGPANPVPPGACEGDTCYEADLADRVTALRSANLVTFEQPRRIKPNRADQDGRSGTAWRLVAPALSGLAVVAVIVSLTLAAGQGSAARRPPGVSAAMTTALPRYYVTASEKHFLSPVTLFVHSSLTGRALGSVHLPKSMGFFAEIAAKKSDREFFIVSDRTSGHLRDVAALYRLRLAANGRVLSFSTISANLGLGEDNTVDGIALSPDGTKLAVAVQITLGTFPDSELVVMPLNHAARRVWITRQETAYIWDPVWTSNKDIAFLWWDHLRGKYSDFTARTQERLLATTVPGSNLLSSRVLATSTATDRLGEINNAFATPRGGPIIAATSQNVPTLGLVGRATVRLVALSPATGKVIKVFGVRVLRYHNEATIAKADYFFRVFGLDATGSHALVAGPAFGVLSNGKFIRLPGGPGLVEGAGW